MTAVDDLSFTVDAGKVTGFLGPNGAGKSTTMRCMIGHDRVDGGQVTFDGKPYRSSRRPVNEIGTLLDAGYVHPRRTVGEMIPGRLVDAGLREGRIANDSPTECCGISASSSLRGGPATCGKTRPEASTRSR